MDRRGRHQQGRGFNVEMKLGTPVRLRNVSIAILLIASVLTAPLHADSPIPEPKYLQVLGDPRSDDILLVEPRDEVRQGQLVSADLFVRTDKLIAYGLTFRQQGVAPEWLAHTAFVPLYPKNTYYLGNFTFQPDGSITITGDKLGYSVQDNSLMVITNLAVLVMHLVGAKPPVDSLSGLAAVMQSVSVIPGPVGTAGTFGVLMTDIAQDAKPTKIAQDIVETVSDVKQVPEWVAALINELMKEDFIDGAEVSATLSSLKLLLNCRDVVDALEQLSTLPRHTEIKIVVRPMPPELIAQSDYPIVEVCSESVIWFELQNVGFTTWRAGQDFMLVNTNGQPLGCPRELKLEHDIPVSASTRWSLPIRAPCVPGVYRTEWQMRQGGRAFGPVLAAEIIVIPRNSDNLSSVISEMMEDARHNVSDQFDEAWKATRQDIEDLILTELERQVSDLLHNLCGGQIALGLLAAFGIYCARACKPS